MGCLGFVMLWRTGSEIHWLVKGQRKEGNTSKWCWTDTGFIQSSNDPQLPRRASDFRVGYMRGCLGMKLMPSTSTHTCLQATRWYSVEPSSLHFYLYICRCTFQPDFTGPALALEGGKCAHVLDAFLLPSIFQPVTLHSGLLIPVYSSLITALLLMRYT